MQLSFTQLGKNTLAKAGDVNKSFVKLFNLINSGIEQDNIKDGAVTTPKIQDKAVTDGKRLLGTGFRAGLSAIQSIPSTTVTVIDFSSLTDYERFDLGGHYDTTLKRFVATQKVSMTFDALARINNLDENKIVYIYLRKNGSSFQRGYNLSPAANAEVQVKVEAPVILDIGDYLDVAIYHNNGTTLDLQATDYSNFSGTLNGVVS